MLRDYLQKAIEDLEALIELTKSDIEDIKQARHERLFDRIDTKEAKIAAFEREKSLIDKEIVSIMKRNPGKSLQELLDDETVSKLTSLRERLETLQDINRRYARFVIAVGEFYNSMFEEVLPTESNGYEGKSTKLASLIEVRV